MIWDKHKSAFDVFSDTEIQISDKTDYDDYTEEYTEVSVCSLTGDMQMYSGGLALEEYGLNIECEKRFFCADVPGKVKEGMTATESGIKYSIVRVVRDRLGGMLLLKREATQ